METKFYEIRKTDEYKNADSVYTLLPINYKYRIESLISKEVYTALLFSHNVLSKIECYCDKFFDCKEHGLSYELGCYFQKHKYQHAGFIESDINRFNSLLRVYNSEQFPEEYRLISELVNDLKSFLEDWLIFEKEHPELFKTFLNYGKEIS